MTSDGLNEWIDISAGLDLSSSEWVHEIALHGDHLYLATAWGVWRRPVSEVVSVSQDVTGVPSEMMLHQNYPNPFNPATSIRFEIRPARTTDGVRSGGDAGYVMLGIYDLLGRKVATIVDEKLGPGRYVHSWDAAGLPSGIYFYRLQAGSYVETRKLVLLR